MRAGSRGFLLAVGSRARAVIDSTLEQRQVR